MNEILQHHMSLKFEKEHGKPASILYKYFLHDLIPIAEGLNKTDQEEDVINKIKCTQGYRALINTRLPYDDKQLVALAWQLNQKIKKLKDL